MGKPARNGGGRLSLTARPSSSKAAGSGCSSRKCLRSNRQSSLRKRTHSVRSRAQNARRRFFEHAKIGALIAALPDPLCDVVRFAYLTGWCWGQILDRQWSNIDLAGQVIMVRDSTNGAGPPETVTFGYCLF